MKILQSTRNFLFLLLAFLLLYKSIYSEGSFVSKITIALILAISGFFFIKTLLQKNNKNLFYKSWTALFLLNFFGFIFSADFSSQPHIGMFMKILMTSLTFYPFYYFSGKGILTSKHLLWFFVIILPITILQYYFNASQILSERLSGNEDLVNNISYSFVTLIPFVFLFKKNKIISMSSMFVLVFFIIQGAKRGALVTGAIGFVVFIYFSLRTIEKKHRFKSYILFFVALTTMSYFAYFLYIQNEFLISRIQGFGFDSSSGRDIIYTNIFNSWLNSNNWVNIFFGFGFASSLILSGTGNYAHNDWLELLSNFGLLGVSIYAVLFVSTAKYLKYPNWDAAKQFMLLAILLIWGAQTLFSMSYASETGYLKSMLLAYLIGEQRFHIKK